MTIRVLIADDHRVVAEGLRSLIEAQPDMEVVGLSVDGLDVVRRALEMQPDVIVMDGAMPLMNGTEAARTITERSPRIRVVMLSMHSNSVHVYRALQAGARGYVVKKSLASELVDAIRTVHSGRRYLSKPLDDELLERIVSDVPEDPLSRLSARERQVLQMIAEGSSVVEIASTLSLSRKTVETYRERMLEKIGLDNLAALVKFAIQQGLVSLE
jgi:two-component system, NarL family, response regulator NreC